MYFHQEETNGPINICSYKVKPNGRGEVAPKQQLPVPGDAISNDCKTAPHAEPTRGARSDLLGTDLNNFRVL